MGGVESHVYEVSRRLAAEGLAVTVLTADPSGQLPGVEILEGVEVRRVRAWPKKMDYYFAPGIYRAVRQGHWDLVHIQSYHTFVPLLAMAAAWKSRIPFVVTFHGGGHSSRFRNRIRKLQRAFLGAFLRRAARLVAVARFETAQYGEELHIPENRFTLIPNGCNLPKAVLDRQAPPGHLIASVGRLESYKGHQRLIEAMPSILEKVPDSKLWIAGSGPEEPRLQRSIERLDIQHRVEIRPIPIHDRQVMAEELSNASLFVLLSEFETHPIAVLEAISLGVPALVTDTSGLRELAENGLAHSIPLSSTSEEIARAVVEMLQHPQKPPQVQLTTWDDCARDLSRLYREILG
jgi:glycosyltransferase involved in cell wall biosynthesis